MKRKKTKPRHQPDAQTEKDIHDFMQWANEQGWALKHKDEKNQLIFVNRQGQESPHPPLLVQYLAAVANGYKPINKEFLRLAAGDVTKRFPDNWGFILIAAPIGEGGRTTYTSNVDRGDAIKLLKEFLFHVGEGENWMKHIA